MDGWMVGGAEAGADSWGVVLGPTNARSPQEIIYDTNKTTTLITDVMMEDDCPFCSLSRSYPHQETLGNTLHADADHDDPILYSTPSFFVVMDQMPLTKGHLLVIPRAHSHTLAALPASTASTMGAFLPPLLRALATVLSIDDSNVIQNNGERASQTVPHVHFHIVPRPGDGTWGMFGKPVSFVPSSRTGHGHGYKWLGHGRRELDTDSQEVRDLKHSLRTAIRHQFAHGLWTSVVNSRHPSASSESQSQSRSAPDLSSQFLRQEHGRPMLAPVNDRQIPHVRGPMAKL